MELLQLLARRTDVPLVLSFSGEGGTREGAVRPVRFIEDRNVRRDLLLVDQRGEIVGKTVGTVGREVVRPEASRNGFAEGCFKRSEVKSNWLSAMLRTTASPTKTRTVRPDYFHPRVDKDI